VDDEHFTGRPDGQPVPSAVVELAADRIRCNFFKCADDEGLGGDRDDRPPILGDRDAGGRLEDQAQDWLKSRAWDGDGPGGAVVQPLGPDP
jgi:hypothetical protein